jgi:hypothetical protein
VATLTEDGREYEVRDSHPWLPWLIVATLFAVAAYLGWLCWAGRVVLGRLGL